LNEKLLQKEKLSAVGQVIGMVIHDLRTPINNIKQTVSLMREEGEQGDLIGLIDQSVEHASEIFDDFLDFIKENPIKKVPVSINKIAKEVIKQVETRKGFGQISITQNIPETLLVPGDESKLKRALINLFNNAIDVLSNLQVKNGTISISAQIATEEIIIIIADNGPGIPSEISSMLFEPFITKHKKNGTGLGLAIVKQFITMHGGTIAVNNSNGAVFTISLPPQ
jgi:signal transduction histidine kinase